MIFFCMVDGIPRYFNRDVLLGHVGLATESGLGLQAPRAIQQILLTFVQLIQRFEALANHHMAGCASATHVTGVLDVDAVIQHGLANGCTNRRFNRCARRTVLRMGKEVDDGHDGEFETEQTKQGSDGFDLATCQGSPYAPVHAQGSKGFCALRQGLGTGFYGGRLAGMGQQGTQVAHSLANGGQLGL